MSSPIFVAIDTPDLARAVALDQDLVDDLGAGAGRQAQHEGLGLGGLESLDATWKEERC